MILETCSRASCVQMVDGLRAALAERDAELRQTNADWVKCDAAYHSLRAAAQLALEALRFIELFIGVYDGVTLDKSRAEASRSAAITALTAALESKT